MGGGGRTEKKGRELRIYHRENEECFSDYHPNYLSVVVVLQGSAGVRVNGTAYFLTAPYLLLVNPGANVEYIFSSGLAAEAVSFTTHFLNPRITPETIQWANYQEIAQKCDFHALLAFRARATDYYRALPLKEGEVETARRLFADCKKEIWANSPQWSCQAREVVLRLLDLTDTVYNRCFTHHAPAQSGDPGLWAAKEYIDTHFFEDISLARLCEIAMLNRNALNGLFSLHLQATTRGYIIKCRMDHAKKLLATTALSVSEISEKCGYHYVTYFNRAFKECTGCVPEAYRKKAFITRNPPVPIPGWL